MKETTKKTWISNCCNASAVTGYGDEGTNHFRCSSCGEPCDAHLDEPITRENIDTTKDWQKIRGTNNDGDDVVIYSPYENGDIPISFNNDKEGYAGATVIPKKMLEKLITEACQEAIKEICICAAVKDTTGYIWRGHRHGDSFVAILDAHREPDAKQQGFMTSSNRFVDREEGRKLQDDAGIPSAAVDDGGYRGDTLFSEDLY